MEFTTLVMTWKDKERKEKQNSEKHWLGLKLLQE